MLKNSLVLLACLLIGCTNKAANPSIEIRFEEDKVQLVDVNRFEIQQKFGEPLFVLDAKFNKTIPNGTGLLEFKDGTTGHFDEFPREGPRLINTDVLRIWLDKLPFDIKTSQEFRDKFPLEVKMCYRLRVPKTKD